MNFELVGLVRRVGQVRLVRQAGRVGLVRQAGRVRLVGLVGLVGNDKKVNNLTKYKKYEYYSKRACTSDFGLAW